MTLLLLAKRTDHGVESHCLGDHGGVLVGEPLEHPPCHPARHRARPLDVVFLRRDMVRELFHVRRHAERLRNLTVQQVHRLRGVVPLGGVEEGDHAVALVNRRVDLALLDHVEDRRLGLLRRDARLAGDVRQRQRQVSLREPLDGEPLRRGQRLLDQAEVAVLREDRG